MTRHCTSDELMAVADGSRDAASVPHLSVCDQCRDECEHLRRVLLDVRAVTVPEPSPLYWEHLSMRVREAVTAERSSAGPPEAWPDEDLRWWHPARLAWPATIAVASVLGVVLVTPWLLAVRTKPLLQVDASVKVAAPAGERPAAPLAEAARPISAESGAREVERDPASGGGDESIGLMLELAGSLDFDAVQSVGFVTTEAAADGAVADLSLEERLELERLLREALRGAGA